MHNKRCGRQMTTTCWASVNLKQQCLFTQAPPSCANISTSCSKKKKTQNKNKITMTTVPKSGFNTLVHQPLDNNTLIIYNNHFIILSISVPNDTLCH